MSEQRLQANNGYLSLGPATLGIPKLKYAGSQLVEFWRERFRTVICT